MIGNKIKIKIENLDQKIFSDEKWVLFILNQVISNAIKYKKKKQKYHFVQDVKRMKYFWKSETMELESHQKICQGSRTKGILELQEETIKNQQGWGYICVRNFAANYN